MKRRGVSPGVQNGEGSQALWLGTSPLIRFGVFWTLHARFFFADDSLPEGLKQAFEAEIVQMMSLTGFSSNCKANHSAPP